MKCNDLGHIQPLCSCIILLYVNLHRIVMNYDKGLDIILKMKCEVFVLSKTPV